MELNEKQKKEYELKVKSIIQSLFKQIKNGCYRNKCYNYLYCPKSDNFSYKYTTDKNLISDCLGIIKNSDNIENLICYDFKLESYSSSAVANFDSWFDAFSLNNSFSPSKANCYNINYKFDIFKEIDQFNKAYEKIIEYLKLQKIVILKENTVLKINKPESIISYLFKIYFNFINFILVNSDFMYNITFKIQKEQLLNEFFILFNTYRLMNNSALNNPPNEMFILDMLKNYNKESFEIVVSSLQNFLTVLLVDLTSAESGLTASEMVLLVGLMRLIEIYYYSNEYFKFIPKESFYNDSVNHYLSIKAQCSNYYKYHNINEKAISLLEEADVFSFIKYFFTYDIGSKKDIISIYNTKVQSNEIFSSAFDSMDYMLSGLNSVYLQMNVRRTNLVEDTLDIISKSNINFKKPLKVKFIGEQGVDEGGVKKEFFMLLIRQLFDPNYGMFKYNEDKRIFWFNLYSFESTLKFELIGILFGLAIFNDVIIDIKFPSLIYKKLLNIPCSLEDFNDIDSEIYNSLVFLKNTNDNNLEEALGSSFEIEVENFGHRETIELKEGGKDILISQSNKQEYIALYLDWFFNKSIKTFYDSFYKGFYRVSENKIFKILDEKELELIICGTQELDFNDLKAGCIVGDGYDENSETIKLFWEVVMEFNHELKKKFLFFLTGCDRAPVKGLQSLKMIIGRYGPDSDKIPCAHTCFNFFLLPDYMDKNKLRLKLMIAVENSEGFGLQ